MPLLNSSNLPISPKQRVTDLATDIYARLRALTQSVTGLNAWINTFQNWKEQASEDIGDLRADMTNAQNNIYYLSDLGVDHSEQLAAIPAQIDARVQAVVGAAPAALDTLQEIAAALADDDNTVAALTSTVAGKADQLVVDDHAARLNAIENILIQFSSIDYVQPDPTVPAN